MKSNMKVTFPCLLIGLIAFSVFAQRSPQGSRNSRGDAALVNDPFRGITTKGEIETGLFQIESTGVDTKPVKQAAVAFLAGLSEEQRERTQFPVTDMEWRQWDNRHSYKRKGVGFDEMDEHQRELAFGLMKASLSAKGLKLSQDIMKLNGTLAELCDNFEEYGEWLYWITVMGEPSATEPWGWQVDGHHLVINYFVLGDQVVMSPVFVGSEPVHAEAGKFKGTIVMQEEQNKGLELLLALTKEQREVAILNHSKTGNDCLAQAYKDNIVLDYAGIQASELDDKQRSLLLEVIETYVGNMSEGHAAVKMNEVKEHLDRTFFAWIGGATDESVYYYRIHSPVILIEFDHERRVAPFRTSKPTRDHIHAVLRTPNGNDYGKDLLRQHRELHHSGADHKH